MARKIPFKGANTASFYVAETEPGVTPDSPVWLPLRNTGGVPAITRDALVSNELDGSRETSAIRTGNKQAAGEYAIELSSRSQDDFLAGALSSTWSGVIPSVAHTITVDPVLKKYTSADAITNIEVGDLVAFTGLAGNNSLPFIVTSHDGLSVTGDGINHELTAQTSVASTLHYPEHLYTGSQCKTFSILTWFKGECSGEPAWLITRGVEISGFSMEMAVNAFVTGTFPIIGVSQSVPVTMPPGTFSTIDKPAPYSSVDVSAFNGTVPLELVDTLTLTNDNAASAQFALGDDSVAFIEKGRATNTFSLSSKLYSMELYNAFLNEEQVEITAILSRGGDAMSFTLKNAELTEATPEISGAESVTQSISGQATGNSVISSIVIQRLAIS